MDRCIIWTSFSSCDSYTVLWPIRDPRGHQQVRPQGATYRRVLGDDLQEGP